MEISTVKYVNNGYLVNNQFFVPNDDSENEDYKSVQEWVSLGNSIEAADVMSLSEIKQDKITSVKTEAGRRILVAYPEWRQRNHMAAVVDIQNKELIALKSSTTYTLSADELAIVTAAQAAKTEIFNIRAKSDELEASLDSMTLDQLKAFDPTDDNNWS